MAKMSFIYLFPKMSTILTFRAPCPTVYAAKLDRVELECSLKGPMRSKSSKNMINFIKKFVVTSIGVSLL